MKRLARTTAGLAAVASTLLIPAAASASYHGDGNGTSTVYHGKFIYFGCVVDGYSTKGRPIVVDDSGYRWHCSSSVYNRAS